MSRKDFEAIAAQIVQIVDKDARVAAAIAVARACANLNPRFNTTKFFVACKVI